jgi:DNA polymerase III epsilon subunit-like protein
MTTLILDTETTGLLGLPACDIVEVAIVDEHGITVFHTLCNPGHPIPGAATDIHGITDSMVAQAPSSDIVRQQVLDLVRGHDLVIYNADYDCQYFPGIAREARSIHCCMERFAEWKGEWEDWRDQYRWHRLTVAAGIAGCFEPGAHRALPDARMCAGVWRFLEKSSIAAGITC